MLKPGTPQTLPKNNDPAWVTVCPACLAIRPKLSRSFCGPNPAQPPLHELASAFISVFSIPEKIFIFPTFCKVFFDIVFVS